MDQFGAARGLNLIDGEQQPGFLLGGQGKAGRGTRRALAK